MKIVDPGHEYLLDAHDIDPVNESQAIHLKFMKRAGDGYPYNHGQHPGTNSQEVLRALIDRAEYINKQNPCAETEAIIGNLKTALLLFEVRAARRRGNPLSGYASLRDFESRQPCKACGHIDCNDHD